MKLTDAIFQAATCLPCCWAITPAECYLDLPSQLIDGNTTPFANSVVAQNFFDNSGAAVGCTASNIGDPPCDCLAESQTTHAANVTGSTDFQAVDGNYLHLISHVTPLQNISANHALLFRANYSAATAISINTQVSASDYLGFAANVSLYDSSLAFVSSNVISNANIDTVGGWTTWQNITVPNAGIYYLRSEFQSSPLTNNAASQTLSYGQNAVGNIALDLCSLRAAYTDGNSVSYIVCQSA